MADGRPPRRTGPGRPGGPGGKSPGGSSGGPRRPGSGGGRGPAGPASGARATTGGRRAARVARSAPPPGAQKAPGSGDRIAKLLARAGVGSRRDIERMIAEGRVALNGVALETPATILKSLDGVTVDGKPVAAAEATRIFLFHKPSGFLTAARDPGGRPTIYDALPPGVPRLVPVGRLDMNTEGLLLLTNDGELKRALELPANAVPRTYRVRALGEVRQQDLEALAMGVTLEGMHYGPVDASVDRRARADGANIWLTMTLTEGKNREVRKLCEAMGLKVSRLIRTSYGPFRLGELAARGLEEVPGPAVANLKRSLIRTPKKAD
ncbi:MAG: pseudouridine synthase [Sphingomonas sp.]|nr:MAG: pseudouridine synthase [Sphingomonas sp.]